MAEFQSFEISQNVSKNCILESYNFVNYQATFRNGDVEEFQKFYNFFFIILIV